MNTQLVDSLVQIIQILSKEERALLEEKLKKPDSPTLRQRIIKRGKAIEARHGGTLDPPSEEIIRQMPEERSERLMRSGFPQFYPDES